MLPLLSNKINTNLIRKSVSLAVINIYILAIKLCKLQIARSVVYTYIYTPYHILLSNESFCLKTTASDLKIILISIDSDTACQTEP